MRRPHMHVGRREPLSREELVRKFHGNAEYGGWRSGDARALLEFCLGIASRPDLSGLVKFRL